MISNIFQGLENILSVFSEEKQTISYRDINTLTPAKRTASEQSDFAENNVKKETQANDSLEISLPKLTSSSSFELSKNTVRKSISSLEEISSKEDDDVDIFILKSQDLTQSPPTPPSPKESRNYFRESIFISNNTIELDNSSLVADFDRDQEQTQEFEKSQDIKIEEVNKTEIDPKIEESDDSIIPSNPVVTREISFQPYDNVDDDSIHATYSEDHIIVDKVENPPKINPFDVETEMFQPNIYDTVDESEESNLDKASNSIDLTQSQSPGINNYDCQIPSNTPLPPASKPISSIKSPAHQSIFKINISAYQKSPIKSKTPIKSPYKTHNSPYKSHNSPYFNPKSPIKISPIKQDDFCDDDLLGDFSTESPRKSVTPIRSKSPVRTGKTPISKMQDRDLSLSPIRKPSSPIPGPISPVKTKSPIKNIVSNASSTGNPILLTSFRQKFVSNDSQNKMNSNSSEISDISNNMSFQSRFANQIKNLSNQDSTQED